MSNKIDLSGRCAVITGGAQGIGRAIVERFLDSNATVAIWDRDLGLAQKTAAELKNRGRIVASREDMPDDCGTGSRRGHRPHLETGHSRAEICFRATR